VVQSVWGKILMTNIFQHSLLSFILSVLSNRNVVGHALCSLGVVGCVVQYHYSGTCVVQLWCSGTCIVQY